MKLENIDLVLNLNQLADRMDEIAESMKYLAGSDTEQIEKSKELWGAAEIARGWADHIYETKIVKS